MAAPVFDQTDQTVYVQSFSLPSYEQFAATKFYLDGADPQVSYGPGSGNIYLDVALVGTPMPQLVTVPMTLLEALDLTVDLIKKIMIGAESVVRQHDLLVKSAGLGYDDTELEVQ